MDIKIENIGKIKSADIAVNGLTVIAGENNTGKSTVGKLLFAIVKAMSRYKEDLKESKEILVAGLTEKLYLNLRKNYKLSDKIKEEFDPQLFYKQLRLYVIELFSFSNRVNTLTPDDHLQLNNILKEKQNILKEFNQTAWEKNKETLKSIFDTILLDEDKEVIIKRALNKAFYSEFHFELNPKHSHKQSNIECTENQNKIFNINIENNKISEFKLHDDLLYEDITFIETPIFLQMYELIQNSGTLFEATKQPSSLRPQVSLHIKDLVTKFEISNFYKHINIENKELKHLTDTIANIIEGEFIYKDEDKDFAFTQHVNKNNNISIKPINTASGIKAFGVIQLLIQANIINERSLLVIDEPENHLHPKWQVEYARLIIELVKHEIPVIISSHSPYMIQALKHFSDKEDLSKRTSFYLANIKEGEFYADFDNVTDDLNKIFSKLAQPLKDLVWK